MDKREHTRFESHSEAKLITPDGVSYPCHIADFSQEGIRIFWPEEESLSLKVNDTLQLYVTLEQSLLNISVLCLYQDGNSAGFKLNQPNSDLFLKLQSMNQSSRNNGALSTEKREKYKSLFGQRVKESSHGIINQWHNEVLEEIFSQAGKSLNNEEQQDFYSAEKQIKESTKLIQHKFLTTIAEQLKCWHDGKPQITPSSEHHEQESRNLSLVQQDEFEDWLLSKVTSTHLQSRLSHASFEVRQLLDMISEAKPEHCFNPLSANVITEAFRSSIEDLSLNNKVRQIAFDVFEQTAGQQLQSVYQWLLKQVDVPLAFRHRRPVQTTSKAISNGHKHKEQPEEEPQILPGGHASESPAAQNASAQSAHTNNLRADIGQTPDNSGPSATGSMQAFRQHQAQAQQAYSNIQNLLSLRYQRIENGQTSASTGAELSQSSIPVADHQQVQSALQQLWQTSDTQAGNVRQDLEQALASQKMGLPSENREALDTLEHVTQNLVNSDKISDFIKPFIEELEQPLSIMMLNDPSMMFNPQHPGRVALNSLSKLGKMTTTGQERISETLKTLLHQIDNNSSPAALEAQLQELQNGVNTMLVEAERRAKMNADRAAQAAEGEHRVEQARQKIARLTSKDTSGRTLPVIVMEWLEQGWKPFLTLIYLRETSKSKRLHGGIKLYRQVLSLFNPGNAGKIELLERFKPLVTLMHHELDQLNGSRPDHTRWHNEILHAAEQHLEIGTIEKAIEVPEVIAEEESPVLEGRGVRRALNLQVGDWLLLVEQDQNVSVVWMAEDGSKFACVNHSGMKVVDYTLEELAASLEDGSVKRLYEQEESAVDQSLDALVQQIYNDLSAQANTDALTLINTRPHFMRHLKEEAAKSHRSNLTHTLCMIDIDQFKLINSEYGVEGGDECLKAVAQKLSECSDNKNNCARMGSNEFAILFQHCDLAKGEETARGLKKELEQMDIVSGTHKFRIHLSMGVSELNYQVSDEIDLVAFAESACLSAKDKGGSRVYRYIEDDNARIKRDEFMSWANKLNQALEADQLDLLCLPVTAIQDAEKEQRQYEVIISIEDENGIQIPPLEYLQAAEHYSRMYLVDRWTLEQLIKWMSNNEDEVAKIDRFMLKLSGYSMNDDTLLAFIFDQAREHNIPVNKLCFELNETSAIQNIEDAADFMHEMRSLGCEFTLSDFGTGQSSFEYLKQLPVNYVKIDHTFIAELVTSSADYAMVKSIHEIAHFMAKKTIAEQVNDEDTLDILRSIGIDLAMGGELLQAIPLDKLGQLN